MNDIQKLAVATAMRRMFESSFFSICTVDTCLALAGVIPPKAAYQTLQVIHCCEWKAMPRELIEAVPKLLSECFGGVNIADLMAACEPAKSLGGLRRLQ